MDILPQLLVNALITGSIYALVTAGLALCYGVLRILNFAHGHLLMLGAYLFLLAHENLGLAPFAAWSFTLVTAALCGACFHLIFVAPFNRLNPFLTLVSTLALSIILEACVAIAFGVNVLSIGGSQGFFSYNLGQVYITPVQVRIVVLALAIFALMLLLIQRSRFGRFLRATREHPEAAESLSLNTSLINLLVFCFSSVLAAVAGVMIAYETNLQPTMGSAYTIKAFAAMILGGLGNFWGAILGSYLLGLTENLAVGLSFGSYSLPSGYKDAFAFVIILVVLLFRPQGLFGSAVRRV